jgi:hypothetical protein
VNGRGSQDEVFDVFLCHNSEDKPAVREISKKLVKEGIKPWLDVEQIPPGSSWQTELGEQIESIKSAAVFVGNSGIGPWQSEEIQAFLSQFIERKCPVIPTILGSATTTPELPWTLKNRHRVDFRLSDPDPLKQLIWGITRQKPTAKEKLIPGRDELAASKRTSFERRLHPPLAHLPDQDQTGQLEILRRRVNEYWIDGVLKHSLHNEVLISLGKREIGDAVDAPWKYTVELSDSVSSGPLVDRDVNAIYDATGLLLILGEPGSGKTTTLLDLTRTLLDRARDDIKERVPVVLNLSSWKKKKKQPLVEWMSDELSEKYRVPRKIAHFWLQNNYLLPLLDGLDEVQTSVRPNCVATMNEFIEKSNPSGLVVCCRLNEYRWLPERLKLNGAICLEPLSKDEAAKYFARGGSKLAALREAVNRDSVLRELAQTPLMLSVMSLAFQGVNVGELARQKGKTLEEGRKQIFRLYTEQMFQRKGTASLVFPQEKIIDWLSWLARKMREHSWSVFLVEGLQPSWLRTGTQRAAYATVVPLIVGLIVWLLCGLGGGSLADGLAIGLGVFAAVGLGQFIVKDELGWSESRLQAGLWGAGASFFASMLIGGFAPHVLGAILIGGLIGGLGSSPPGQITSVEMMAWRWNQFWKGFIGFIPPPSYRPHRSRLIIMFFFFLFGALLVAMGEHNLIAGLLFGLYAFLFTCLTPLLLIGLISGLARGFTDTVKTGKASPNEGMKLSRKNALVAFLISCLTFGLFGLIVWRIVGLRIGLVAGLVCGLITGLNRGGSAVIKHYALRLVLWISRCTPLNFIKFLDHCDKLTS